MSSSAVLGSIRSASPATSFHVSSLEDSHGGGQSVPGRSPVLRKCRATVCSPGRPWLLGGRGGAVSGRMRGRRSARAAADEPAPGERGSVKTEKVPAWADPDSTEPPPWASNERPASQEPPQDLPFLVYLFGSVLVAIAAVGSVFEYYNQHPAFGVIYPDNPAYAPLLGFLAISGLPSTMYLLFKAIQLANKASEEADAEDGFRR